MSQRTVIIVSPYFLPSGLAGVHRARLLAKHLPAAGWKPIVVCVDEAYHEERLDHTLLKLAPENSHIIKVKALPIELTRPIGLGDISLRAWIPLRRALFGLLETRSVDVVLITGSPYYPMLLARNIKRRYGVPVVLDFQDPWISNWGAVQPVLSKAGLVHQLAKQLEPRAVAGASFITSVSEIQNTEMLARYPGLSTDRMASIPIGGDPEDFAALAAAYAPSNCEILDQRFINLSYVGTFLPRAGSLVRTLFRSFAQLRAKAPALASRIRLNFVGTSNQPKDATRYRVRPLAEAEGIAEAVHEIPRRLAYLDALGILTRSHGILLIGSDEPHYTASKIYPALMSKRPFLSLFHRSSSAHAILSATRGGRAFGFDVSDELAALEAPIAEALQTLAASPESLGRVHPRVYASYEAHAIACRFANIFDALNIEG
jgi:glycosyltransferase involved in cell wall biosynthesis